MMTDKAHAELMQIGKSAMESIQLLVDALDCDYERLAELQDERDDAESVEVWRSANPDEADELDDLESEANGTGEACADRDDAEQQICNDCLSVEVRSDWTTLGQPLEANEYLLLLTTGGPAVRIIGELTDGEPTSARLQVQDWGTPWTDYVGADQDALLSYARCFYFGD